MQQALELAVEEEFSSNSYPGRTVEDIRLCILEKVANILNVPFTHCKPHICKQNECIILEEDILRIIDKEWCTLLASCDYKVSNQEKKIRENFESSKRHFYLTDLTKFLGVLFRKNSIDGHGNDKSEKILKHKKLNALLAVDGFDGIFPSDFKNYLKHLAGRLKSHIKGVRLMYDALDEELTGTDCACLIFLVLCNLYTNKIPQMNDYTQHILLRTKGYVKSFLQKNAQYYTELEIILKDEEQFLQKMSQIYMNAFEDDSELVETITYKMCDLTTNNVKLETFSK